MKYLTHNTQRSAPRPPWNKGKLIGQRPPLKPQEVWSIRVRLQMAGKMRDLALFNLAIDSKLRGCDLTKLMLRQISTGSGIAKRAMVMQQKTGQTVQFEISAQDIEILNLCPICQNDELDRISEVYLANQDKQYRYFLRMKDL